tara:strand:+ start:592 stop:756 length:165 start_codon:yes stop_codon:yes gene_type:complete
MLAIAIHTGNTISNAGMRNTGTVEDTVRNKAIITIEAGIDKITAISDLLNMFPN